MSSQHEQALSRVRETFRGQVESPPNFSRPRLGHQRSYSTGLPFPYLRGESYKSQQNDYPQFRISDETKVAPTPPPIEQKPRALRTMDDGIVVDPRARRHGENPHWAEEDVKDAFQRWALSDTDRKKHKRPDFVNETQYMPNLYVQEDRGPRKAQKKGPVYEKVDGVVMDTRPGAATGPYDMEDTLPVIEAQDIRELPPSLATKDTSSLSSEDDQGTLPSLTSASSAESSGVSPELWSESSGSSSTASTDNSIPQPYQHMSKQYVSLTENEDGMLGEAIGSQQGMSYGAVVTDVPELHGKKAPSSLQHNTSPVVARKLPMDVIDEEERVPYSEDLASDGAPAPTIQGVKDEDVTVHKHKLHIPSIFKHDNVEHPPATSQDQSPPTRVLASAGIGDDKHVYELEAAVPTELPANESTTSAASVDNNAGANETDDSHGHGLLDKVEHGVSKAVHALHEKVKKNVTFSPVNDVRFMTPSPQQSQRSSMYSLNAVDAPTTQ